MQNSIRCTACGVLLPVARNAASKWFMSLAAAGLGVPLARTPFGKVLLLGAGVLAIAAVNEAARPVCGSCSIG